MSERPGRTIVGLLGPTAAGKTDVALALAERVPATIVSVDSAMVYRGMDIGTAKPDPATRARHPHALVDIRDPAEAYSVAEFLRDAAAAVESALAADRVPILVGGTMLYFKALREGLAAMPASTPATRERLERRAACEGLAELHRELTAVDPVAAERIHPNNPQRLLRALEVYETSGRPISAWWREQASVPVARALDCELVEFALVPEREALAARIERRFDGMLRAGFVEEVERLRARGDLHAALPSMRSVGYRQVWSYLAGEIDRDSMRMTAVRATRQLAKRQLTWLRSFESVRALAATADPAGEILQYLDAVAILGPSS
jgi:tRNA dimethylallyltransferase